MDKQHRWPMLLLCSSLCCTAAAEDTAQTLQNIEVRGKRHNKVISEQKDREQIETEMIRDTRDLVRYSADVGVSEDGRRMKGFSMRGVEDNRVGISIDGVSLPDSEENSLFARYGNFNNSRLSIDPELVRSIEIVKGADSVQSGSGAIGGQVNYRTLNAKDILLPERSIGGLFKSGYASKNREWVNTIGLAFKTDNVDGALLYTHRHGHEFKSRGGDIEPTGTYAGSNAYDIDRRAKVGAARITPDPATHKNHSYLAKIGWQINPDHRVGASLNGQNNSNYTYEHSYSLTTYWREADDRQKRLNSNLFYEYTPDSDWFAMLRLDADYQKTTNGAVNYKGQYISERVGSWTDPNSYTRYNRGWLAWKDERNNYTRFARFSLRADSQRLQWENIGHEWSFKISAGKRHFENLNNDLNLNEDGSLSGTPDRYTIQYPVKTDMYRMALSNRLFFGENWQAHFGVSYDYNKLKPSSPNDLPCGKRTSMGRLCTETNPAGNSFKNWNTYAGIDWQMTPTWQVGYRFATGHRVPTASEMYFTFESAYGDWLANPKLKAEHSRNHSIFLRGSGRIGDLDITLYQNRYRDFLYEKESTYERVYYGRPSIQYFQQMVNADRARVHGVELQSSLNLDQISPLSKGWKASLGLGYSKGRLTNQDGIKLGMLSVQPLKIVLGLDYESPSQTWGIFNRITFLGRKKAKDAQISEQAARCLRWDDWWLGEGKGKEGDAYSYCGKEEYYDRVVDFRWLNRQAWVYDVFGYYRPNQKLTLRAGVYNVFNRKYHTWDSLRGINKGSTINTVDYRINNQGLERFYAPGRNVALSLEYKF